LSRDIYYRDPELFVKQGFVDRYVDDLAYTLGEQRDALNVVCAFWGPTLKHFLTNYRLLLLKAL
jgi:meiotic recombination protein SPO11